MSWFSLPTTQTNNKSAFSDADSATRWLAGQPQANAPAMLAELVTQIQAFNTFAVAPRQRFKTMEVLRKAIFAVSGECRRRYEYKALPLLSGEQAAFDSSRKLWRACSTAYLHCLQACLENDASIAEASALVAHRIASCLRMEQLSCYSANNELGDRFWQTLHSLWAAAESLGVEHEPVADRLLGETSDSTLKGQYSMMILLHLARPFALSRSQFAAGSRWFARWREQASVLTEPDLDPRSCCLSIDLAQDRALHDNLRPAVDPRWLSVNGVLRKMRQRVDQLAKGESPEDLKLGTLLPADACASLLNELAVQLKYPEMALCETPEKITTTQLAANLENIFNLLGGKGLKETEPPTAFGNTLSADQIAVFGHIVRSAEQSAYIGTSWQVIAQEPEKLRLTRLVGTQEPRLMLNGLLAVRMPKSEEVALASIVSLHACHDGRLCVTADLFAGEPTPLLAEIREKPSGKISRHPAFLLPAGKDGSAATLVLPAGLAARALSIRFFDARTQSPFPLKPVECIRRGSDNESWALAPRA